MFRGGPMRKRRTRDHAESGTGGGDGSEFEGGIASGAECFKLGSSFEARPREPSARRLLDELLPRERAAVDAALRELFGKRGELPAVVPQRGGAPLAAELPKFLERARVQRDALIIRKRPDAAPLPRTARSTDGKGHGDAQRHDARHEPGDGTSADADTSTAEDAQFARWRRRHTRS